MHDFDSTSPEYDNIDEFIAEMQAHPSLLLTAETMLDRLRWLSRDWYSDIQILPGRVYLRADSEQLTSLNGGEHLSEDEIFRLVMLVTRGTKHHADVQRLWTESRKPSEDRTWIALDPFDVSFALDDGSGRFRARVFLSHSPNPDDVGLSVSIRRVFPRLFRLDELASMGMSGLSERFCAELVAGETHSGLVLICGPTGSGKSTTLNSILNEMNTRLRDSRNCVTIEDPIEWVHRDNRMRFIQMEIGRHVDSVQTALTGMLRQDPDIIVIGEIRSREAAVAALDAAETGHLVFATLHAANAVRGLLKLLHWTDKDHAKLGAVVAVIAQQRLLVEEPRKGQSLTSIRAMTSGEFFLNELTGETTPEVADEPDDRRFRSLFTEILLPGKNPKIIKLLADKSDDPAAYRDAHGLAGEDTFEGQFATAVRKRTMTEAWALDHSIDKAAFRALYVQPDPGK